MKKTIKLCIPALTTVIFILFCYFMLPIKNGYMLRWYEEMSFFESTKFFFLQCLYYPGGLLRYAGAWLTQLMYYPILGSTVLILIWLLTIWLTQKVFQLSCEAFPLAVVVPMAMLVSIVQLDDALISMKTVGYIYSNTIGYLFVLAAVGLFRIVERCQALAFALLMLMAGCYFIAGFYALLATLTGMIFMIGDIIRSKQYAGFAFVIIIMATVIMLPGLYYSYFQPTTVDNDLLHLKGLPDLLMESFDFYLWLPFIVASAWLIVLTLLKTFRSVYASHWMVWISCGALCICGIWCVIANKKSEQLRATVLMLRYLERNEWTGITSVMSRIKEPPNYTMRVLNNFALLSLGKQPEDLSNTRPRNIDARHSEKFTMTALLNVPISYYNGDFMLSYRWGMEHCVQYGKRVFFLKYMVKDALLNGEIELARRYNDLLKRTMFHREWAEEMSRYIEDPSLIESNIEFKSILEVAKKD